MFHNIVLSNGLFEYKIRHFFITGRKGQNTITNRTLPEFIISNGLKVRCLEA